ncbi:MAG: alpha/beta hydrolase [Lewinellaceae bacterium]|nr:alpha/beta hydrolase [Saprospiraceae bacterium]MCB9337858.1 alpha/beta hydrolase [Lewinellaceae bacterium]
MKNLLYVLTLLLGLLILHGCQKDEIIGENVSDLLWLENKGAQMPILVEGNTASKTFILILHGGPGGSAKVYNETYKALSDPLEKRYAVAYWDQRQAGNTRGHGKLDDLNVETVVGDLELVVGLLRYRYGQDISIFLFGHSWGGYLGNAFLAKNENQAQVKGWIDVAGAHNIWKLTVDGVELMKTVAQDRIDANSSRKKSWEGIRDFADEVDTSVPDEDVTLKVNAKAQEATGLAVSDDLIGSHSPSGKEFLNIFFSDYSLISQFTNTLQTARSDLWQEILDAPLTGKLHDIETPALLIWGEYDFVVSPTLGQEMLDSLGTPDEDKSLHLFNNAGHSPMDADIGKFVDLIIDFVEKYK